MTFELFGCDISPKYRCYGAWIGLLMTNYGHRSAFALYWLEGDLAVDILWLRFSFLVTKKGRK